MLTANKNGYPKILLIVGLLVYSALCDAQIFKFRHYLSQDAIHGANFTLNRQTPKEIHADIPLSNNMSHILMKGLADTIDTRVPITITSAFSFKIRITRQFSLTQTLAAGFPYTLISGTEFIVPANTLVTVPAGLAFIYSETHGIPIIISGAGLPEPNSKIKALNTTIVRLSATTKGIISVSGGKIMFDPWRITEFTNPIAADPLEVDQNTPIPLELKDGRQKISDPTKSLWVTYRHKTISINSIPFRYRGRTVLADTVHSTGTVTTAFSLAISFGQTWGWSHITTRARNDLSFTLGAFVGPSSVDLNKETVKTPASFVAGRTNPVLSYGINLIFARNGLGVLLAYGFDNAFGKFGNDWIYDKKPWFGFGVSASFPK